MAILRPLAVCCLLMAVAAHAAEYHGQVLFGGVPVPGAVVTATHDGRSVTAITDTQGLYLFPDLATGTWHITVEMTGFAKLEGDATVADSTPQGAWELKLLPLETLLAQTKIEPTGPLAPPLLTRPVTPSKSAKKDDATPAEAMRPADDTAEKSGATSQDGLLINGSENNAATSKYSLAQAFGNHRAGSKSLYTGGIGVILDNSALDARPYSLTGLVVPKASYSRVTGLATLGGPLRIPHLMPRGPQFFVGYQWTRNSLAQIESGLVPTVAERSGDLSGLLNANGTPVTITNPATGQPYTGPLPVSQPAQALLALYPLPNLAGNARYNYQTQVLNNTHTDALQSRLNREIGRRDEIDGAFSFQSSRADAANLFNFRDVTNTLGLNANVNWQHRYSHGMFVTLGYRFSRLRTEVRPNFADKQNISAAAGIAGNSQASEDWGPPSLSFSSGIQPLSDANSAFSRNRTDSFVPSVSHTRGRHTIEAGGEFRRQEFNQFGQQNPRGSFVFTGVATGNDLADFLVGVPDTSNIAFGNPDKYFRQSVYALYANDDWRIRPELTINAGLRWDYGAPLTELKGRLVNIDLANGFTSAEPVLGSQPVGPVSGMHYPTSLVRPDKRGIEPRLGISWRPIPASTLVVRAGYGIYYDTSVYLTSAQSMAQQAPLSKSLSVANGSGCPLSLANGFINCGTSTADIFGIDPNYRIGYAQTWQLSAQRDLPGALVATVSYLGVKGTHGAQEFLPNTYPIGTTSPCPLCPVGFVDRTSGGNSTRESEQIQLRRRLRSGFTATFQYTYSKSVDDDSEVGAQGHVVSSGSTGTTTPTPTANPTIAQNWLNLTAERSPSTFDQRHLVKATLQYTSGMGLGGGTLLGGWRGRLLKQWTASTTINAGSGLPETPIYLTAVPNTGTTGTIRPNLTGAPLYRTAETPVGVFLNASAYTAPAPGQWGTAGRDSITGPEQFSMDASLARTFKLREPLNLDVRLDATNLLNHGVFTAWNSTLYPTASGLPASAVNSTFGLPTSANTMRAVEITGRLRF